MRVTTLLTSAAALAVLVATPAAAADFVAQAGVNTNVFANTSCSQTTANITGHAPVSAENVCTRADIGTGHAKSFASFGHLGVEADTSTHSPSLGAGASGQADFSDLVVFSQTGGTGATTTDVSVNLILDGLLAADADLGGSGARVEGFLIFNSQSFKFVYERFSDGTTGASNGFITSGDLLGSGTVSMRTPQITVGLDTPILFRLHLEDGVGAGGLGSTALADFGESSFKLPSAGPAFTLADGFTVNAGDWLVNNRFIDPLAPTGGVPEPAAWALMILGFGAAGARLRRRGRPRLRLARPSRLVIASAAASALAASASASTQSTFVGPNSDSATQTCSGEVGPKTGSGVVRQEAVCTGAGVGTAIAGAVAAPGHVGASARADSFNGDSLVAKNGAEGIYQDFVTFTSTTPGATTQSISVNFLLDGFMEVGGPFGSADLILGFSMAGADFGLRQNLNTFGGFSSSQNTFVLEDGTLGPTTNARLGTSNIVVPLNSPVLLTFRLETTAVASGPGSLGLIDFGTNSFKFASTPFDLPDGVTANAGDYIVNNHFIDPLAPTGGVPEPAAWGLMILGFCAAGAMIRRRRAVLA